MYAGVCVCTCVCSCREVSLGSTREEPSVKRSGSGSVDKLSAKGSSTCTRREGAWHFSGRTMAGAESQHCREASQLSRERGLCFTPETAPLNGSPRSLWDQGCGKEEERENGAETLGLCGCGSDATLAAVSRSTNDAGPFPVVTPRAGAGTRVGRAQGGGPLEGPGSPFHVKERKYLSPGLPIKLTLPWLSFRWQLLRW